MPRGTAKWGFVLIIQFTISSETIQSCQNQFIKSLGNFGNMLKHSIKGIIAFVVVSSLIPRFSIVFAGKGRYEICLKTSNPHLIKHETSI